MFGQRPSERPLLDISRWGPSGWHFMTAIALAAPEKFTEEHKEHYKSFYETLPPVLPCPTCGVHFKKKLPVPPHALHGRESLFRWIVDGHNEVNRRTRKREWSYDEVKHIYYHWHTKTEEGMEEKRIPWGTVVIIGTLLGLAIYASRQRRKKMNR